VLGKRLITAAILAFCLLAPATAWAGEDENEDEPYASFAVQGTNGYRIIVYAMAEDAAGGPGRILVVAMHKSRERMAYYQAKATVTTTGLQADFGALGRIDLVLAKSGGERTVRGLCGGRTKIERASYWGTFEFHGEQGFTEASANRIAYNPIAIFRLSFCSNEVDVAAAGPEDPGRGALLSALVGPSQRSALLLRAVKNHPEGRVLLQAVLGERRHGVLIARLVEMFADAPALEYDRGLRTATLDPPAPFSGSARFRREAERPGRWSGGLRVDLPGRANVALTRPDLHPKLRRGSYSVSEFSVDRPTLARPLALLEAP
jgi:hypothetical protein